MTNKKDLFRRMAKNKWAYIFILPLMIGAIGFFDEQVLGGAVGVTVQDLRATPEGFLVQVQGNF